jgi:hypothetical protein
MFGHNSNSTSTRLAVHDEDHACEPEVDWTRTWEFDWPGSFSTAISARTGIRRANQEDVNMLLEKALALAG